MTVEIASNADLLSFLVPISVGLGFRPKQDEADELDELLSHERALCAFEAGSVVGSAGAYSLRLSVPGGRSVPTAGIGYVGVLPTHRRRGIATALMRRVLYQARNRGDALAALWPSEELIYGRFGFGIGSLCMSIELPTANATWRDPAPTGHDIVLLDPENAHKVVGPIYDRVRGRYAGLIERTYAWWRYRRIRSHSTENDVFIAAAPALGYAVYRHRVPWADIPEGVIEVIEAVGIGVEGTRAIWQYLFDIDICRQVRAEYLPIDHPLLYMLAEPRKLHSRIRDGLWVRIIDPVAALTARHRGPNSVVIALTDPVFESNNGTWYVGEDAVTRTKKTADLAVDVRDLSAVYLGAATFHQLTLAGRAREMTIGAAARADATLPAMTSPWTMEVF